MDPKQYLKELNIDFKTFPHPPVFTCEEARKHNGEIKGTPLKNLFLKERKSRHFYLVIVHEHKSADLKQLGTLLGHSIKFANEQNMMDLLKLTPGSVSPFGLLNDSEHKVVVIIDKEVWESAYVSFHPNINTETLELTSEHFQQYIKSLKNKYRVEQL